MTTDRNQRILTALVTARALLRESRRLNSGKTHKASSAESILKHVLRRRGWTAAFRRGELTDAQRLELLDDIRQYAREWMRHEAEVLFRAHGREKDASDGRLEPTNSSGRSLREGDEGNPPSLAPEGVERALGQALAHHVRRFFTRAKSFIHEAIIAGAMALGGPEPLTAHDLAEADRQAQVQAQYLDRFEADAHFRTPVEIAEGEPPVESMTAPQFGARAQSYGNAPYTAAQEIGRKASIRAGAIEQRRVHVGLDTPCVQCQEQQGFGWLPIGDPRFLQIGDCICITSCHCHVELRWPDGTIRWAGQSPKRAA